MSDIGSDGVLAGVKELSPLKKLAMHLTVFIVLFGGWELGSRLGHVNELIMPAPTSIAYRLYEMFFCYWINILALYNYNVRSYHGLHHWCQHWYGFGNICCN